MTIPPVDPAPLDPVVMTAWGLADEPRRGPKPALQLEDIVNAAMSIADAEGLSAVSMARVAKPLGYTTMSLYRYVKSKDELLMHMQDAVLGRPDRARSDTRDWRRGLQIWTESMLAQYSAHPWVVDIPITRPPLMPRTVEWMDWALSFLESVPLAPLEKTATLLVLSGYVRNEVSLNVGMTRAQAEHGRADEVETDRYLDQLRAIVDPQALPSLGRLIEGSLFDPPGDAGVADEDAFLIDFGLQRILDGVSVFIERRTGAAG